MKSLSSFLRGGAHYVALDSFELLTLLPLPPQVPGFAVAAGEEILYLKILPNSLIGLEVCSADFSRIFYLNALTINKGFLFLLFKGVFLLLFNWVVSPLCRVR